MKNKNQQNFPDLQFFVTNKEEVYRKTTKACSLRDIVGF